MYLLLKIKISNTAMIFLDGLIRVFHNIRYWLWACMYMYIRLPMLVIIDFKCKLGSNTGVSCNLDDTS